MVHADSNVTVDAEGKLRGPEDEVSKLRPAGDRRPRRDCPVPKPGGMLGELLGFHNKTDVARRKKGNVESDGGDT
jgi:hypothetical protein